MQNEESKKQGNTEGESINKGRDPKGRFAKGNKHGFRPGESGNPAGRPRIRILSDAYKRRLAEIDPHDPQGRTFLELVAERMITLASSFERGSTRAAKEIADRTEGRPALTPISEQPRFKRREDYLRPIQRVRDTYRNHFGEEMPFNLAVRNLSTHMPDILNHFDLTED